MKTKNIFLAVLLLMSAGLTMCKKDSGSTAVVEEEPVVYPIADFTWEVSPTDPQKITFKSKSLNYTSLYWQLGDDSLATSDSLVHTYKKWGRFRIILTARNDKGLSSKKEVPIYLRNPVFSADSVGENYILTKGGQLTVSKENGAGPSGGEGSLKAIDGNPFTKFLAGGLNLSSTPLVLTFQFAEPIVAKAYTFISGNDAPDRDPKSWTFEGSNDGVNWTVLDTKTNFMWEARPDLGEPVTDPATSPRQRRRIFHITSNATAYTYYRTQITANRGSDAVQFSEWTINASQP
ncbi:PKD domain-containing protein [Desertivirga arenae]|uniref:PKD domain-containing protein n=1 Tax=Desertivirga arenae TaxID=2810309 RepID=UPI001A97A2F7|nr:PKD domain-containing protein [Pedobacter sp. SYSU D00823]